jgi:predicted ABC-type ATPase
VNTPRLRIIAGPNGSGKTTLTRYLAQEHLLSFGFYINADDIERKIKTDGLFAFSEFDLAANEREVKEFFINHPLNKHTLQNSFHVQNNIVTMTEEADNYFAAILSDFLRRKLVLQKASFSFETVMSGIDKIQLMQEAQANNYRIYLYYVCTEDVLINKERILSRVLMGEHPVPQDKIASRYIRSLDLLLDAIKSSDRAYLFDNSGQSHELVAEVTGGNIINLKKKLMPGWFIDSVINKLNA